MSANLVAGFSACPKVLFDRRGGAVERVAAWLAPAAALIGIGHGGRLSLPVTVVLIGS